MHFQTLKTMDIMTQTFLMHIEKAITRVIAINKRSLPLKD